MLTDESHEVRSNLSKRMTVGDVCVNVRIFRLDFYPLWALEVVTELGRSLVWDELFDTDVEALEAFVAGAEQLGLAHFLSDARWEICSGSAVQDTFQVHRCDIRKADAPDRLSVKLGSSAVRRRFTLEYELS